MSPTEDYKLSLRLESDAYESEIKKCGFMPKNNQG